MRIYTRGGDQGMTSLIGGRVRKDHLRIEALGAVDEVNAFVGWAVAQLGADTFADLKKDLLEIQHELFDVGSDLAVVLKEGKLEELETSGQGDGPAAKAFKVHAGLVERLERLIDRYSAEAPDITCFVLPGGSEVASTLHLCRVLTRRAERRVVALSHLEPINLELRRYLNRLSDFFFAAARCVNARLGVADVAYKRGGQVFR